MRLSVDTNAYRAYLDGDPTCVELIQTASTLAFPAIVVGELRAGFRNGTKISENEEILRQILARRRVVVHDVTEATSFIYASIWTDLRKKGSPIPTNDMWIAAQCLENDFTLLTRDSHFRHIAGLSVMPSAG